MHAHTKSTLLLIPCIAADVLLKNLISKFVL